LQQKRYASLPNCVYIRLVAQLYETRPGVLLNSSAAGLFVGGYAAWHTGDPIIAWLAVLCTLLCLSLLAVLLLNRASAAGADLERARLLERAFGILSCCITATVGLMCARVIAGSHDFAINMLMTGLMLASIGTAIRNYYRPRIVHCQLASSIVPAVTGLAIDGSGASLVMALGTIAYAYNVVEITNGLYRSAVDAFHNDDRLIEQNLRFEAALTNMAQGLVMFDSDERLVVCNNKYLQMYGLSGEVVRPGLALRELLAHSAEVGNHLSGTEAELYEALSQRFAHGKPVSFTHRVDDGRVFSVFHEPMPAGGWVATHEDITERQAAEARIAHMARHDALTGLPNRVQFQEALEKALARAGDTQQVAVLCLDLDRFKTVNDTLGHPVGDELLVQVAQRLQRCLRPSDMLARLSGDEFAIVQVSGRHSAAPRKLAQKLVSALSPAFLVGGHQIVSSTSIGVALAPADGHGADVILKHADLALYGAKHEGRSRYRFFSADMGESMQSRRQLETDIRGALSAGEFCLHYQPFFCAAYQEIIGFEALLRWLHPTRGLVSPDEFVPLAEETGLIVPLGEWVLREALHEAARWPEHLKLAVNFSPAQFRSGQLVQTVAHALATSGVEAARLELEITEGVLFADTEAALATLHRLRNLGVRTAMDDFGTGYSSLNYLRLFPFDKLKIDQSFVRDLGTTPEAGAIIRTTVALASSLGMSTTAEGVETSEQLQLLQAEGCSEVQGFLLGRPKSAEDTHQLLAQTTASTLNGRSSEAPSGQARVG